MRIGLAGNDWARAGVEIPRPPREVEIRALEVLDWRAPDLVLAVACSKGTYIRVLAEDLGVAAGSCAHLAALRRTSTGGFRLADAVTLERLEAMTGAERAACLLPVDALVQGMPRIDLPESEAVRFRHGVAVPAPGSAPGRAVVYASGSLLGLADVDEGLARPARLVVPPAPGEAVSS